MDQGKQSVPQRTLRRLSQAIRGDGLLPPPPHIPFALECARQRAIRSGHDNHTCAIANEACRKSAPFLLLLPFLLPFLISHADSPCVAVEAAIRTIDTPRDRLTIIPQKGELSDTIFVDPDAWRVSNAGASS